MSGLQILLLILGIMISVAVIGTVCLLALSPKPVIRWLRRRLENGGPLDYPADFAARLQRVEAIRNQTYPSAHGRNTFDLFLPKDRTGDEKLPVIVYIHGGFFVAGDKRGVEHLALSFASEGMAVASMNYQWAPEAKFPIQLDQVCQCIHALHTLEETGCPIDTGRVVLAGDSAGAYYAAQAAALYTNPALRSALGLDGTPLDGKIAGCLLFCGPYDMRAFAHTENWLFRLLFGYIGWSVTGKRKWYRHPLMDSACVPDHVTPQYPPSYITDGNYISFESHGRLLERTLKGKGVFCRSRFFTELEEKVPHVYEAQMSTPNGLLAFNDAVSFLRELGLLGTADGRAHSAPSGRDAI